MAPLSHLELGAEVSRKADGLLDSEGRWGGDCQLSLGRLEVGDGSAVHEICGVFFASLRFTFRLREVQPNT